MSRPVPVALAALALVAACAVPAAAQEPPKPAPGGESAQPAKPQDPTPGAAGAEAGAKKTEPTLRNRRRPRLRPMLPKRDGVVELRVGLFGGFVLGAARKDSLNLLGTRFEFDSDLEMNPVVFIPTIDAAVHLSDRLSIVLDFFTTRMSGSETHGLQTAFDGLNFPAGSRVSADLSVITGSIAARYFASTSERANFEIEAGLRYMGVKFDIEATNAGAFVGKATETTDAFVPFVGFLGTMQLARWRKDPFLVEGRLRFGILGIGDSSDNQANFYVHAYVGLSMPLPQLRNGRFNLRLALGYELWRVDAEREDNQLDEDFEVGFHGPVLRIVVRF